MRMESMRILLVEDDKQTAKFIKKGFEQAGYAVDHAANGLDGLFMAKATPYDAAVVDLMLPKLDGLSMIRQLRKEQVNTPIMILSAKKTVDERVLGLEEGGDDYLVKPFSFTELLIRVQKLMQRNQSVAEKTVYQVDNLRLDIIRRKVTRGEKEIILQNKEFSLLEYLLRNAGRVLSKTMIMEHVWDYNFDPESNVVESRICRLREKIDLPNEVKLIHTIRGVGYILDKQNEDV